MKILICSFAMLLLTACGDGDSAALDDSPTAGVFEATVGDLNFETAGRCRFIGNEEEFFFTNDLEDTPGSIKVSVQTMMESGEKPDVNLLLREVTEDGYIDITTDEILDFTVHQNGADGSGSAIIAKKSGGEMKIDYTPKDFNFAVVCK